MEHWIVYDTATGEVRWRGGGPAGSHTGQQLPDGLALAVVPQAVIAGPEIDLDLLRAFIAARIDAEANAVAGRFITATPTQIGIYMLKEARARAWLADPSASTVMLAGEAGVRGMTVAELAVEVVERADAWTMLADALETLRMGAKTAVAAAPTFGAIVAAGKVDWRGVGVPVHDVRPTP